MTTPQITKKPSAGFTLIELMIVIAILGILASIALPAYQNYVVRSQVSEAMQLSEELKEAITHYYVNRGYFPKNNKSAGVPKSEFLMGNYTKSMKVVNGAIHSTLGNRVNSNLSGKIFTIRPIVVTGSPTSPFSWVCGYAEPPDGMEAVAANHTNLEGMFLPSTCRTWKGDKEKDKVEPVQFIDKKKSMEKSES